MKSFSIVLLLMFASYARAQNVAAKSADSLKKKLESLKPGQHKLQVEKQLFFLFLNSDAKKALALSEMALGEARQLRNDSAICIFDDCVGEAFIYLEKFKQALVYLNQDCVLAQKIGYRQQLALAFCDMSAAYQNQSDYAMAQQYDYKALTIYEQLKDYRQMAVCNFNIGVTYCNNNDYKKAIIYGQKALSIMGAVVNDDVVPNADELIGNAYANLNNRVAATRYYNQSLSIFKRRGNSFGVATILYLLSSTYSSDYQKRIALGLQGQKLWNKIAPDNFYSIYNLGNLGCTYGQMAIHTTNEAGRKNLFNQAEMYLKKALDLAKKTNTKSALIDFNDSLSVVDGAIGNYRDAYLHLKTGSALYDSVYSQDNKNKIASLEGQHEIELRDKQIQITRLEIANQRKQAWFLGGGICFLMMMAALLYRQNRIRKRANKLLDESNRIKVKFFGILNHDLRSPVTNFIHLLYLKQNEADLLDETTAIAYENKVRRSAENLLATMEDLLLWSKGQMENFKPQLEEISLQKLYDYIAQQGEEHHVNINCTGPAGMFFFTDEHYLKTIIQNLTSNAIKALVRTENAIITWEAKETEEGKYLSISDNGPGANEEQLRPLYEDSAPISVRKGLGLHIVRDLARAINCTITVYTVPESGVKIQLAFKN